MNIILISLLLILIFVYLILSFLNEKLEREYEKEMLKYPISKDNKEKVIIKMTKVYLMLDEFYHRIKNKKVQEELRKIGVDTNNSNGDVKDSLIILKEIIKAIENLIREEEYAIVYDIIGIIVGVKYREIFIETFLGSVWLNNY